jgi:hypothetical protein
VKRRCRTELQSRADARDATRGAPAGLPLVQQAAQTHGDRTVALL